MKTSASIKKMPSRILVVDDDTRLRELLSEYLSGEGYSVESADSAAAAHKKIASSRFDIMVLDIMMPGKSGLDFVRDLKQDTNAAALPVLLLTARGEPEDRIAGLELGAEDYLTKPFEPRELCLRIENILRRKNDVTKALKKSPTQIKFGNCIFNRKNGDLYRDEVFINLSSTERTLLMILSEIPNQPISREALSKQLNGISERSVDVQVMRLRKKLEVDSKEPLYLQSVWGKGYVLRTNA